MNSMLLSDEELICEHCGIGLKERPAWSQGSIFRWMHVDSQNINCANNLTSGNPKYPIESKLPALPEVVLRWMRNHRRHGRSEDVIREALHERERQLLGTITDNEGLNRKINNVESHSKGIHKVNSENSKITVRLLNSPSAWSQKLVGEIGVVVRVRGKYMDVKFAGHDGELVCDPSMVELLEPKLSETFEQWWAVYRLNPKFTKTWAKDDARAAWNAGRGER